MRGGPQKSVTMNFPARMEVISKPEFSLQLNLEEISDVEIGEIYVAGSLFSCALQTFSVYVFCCCLFLQSKSTLTELLSRFNNKVFHAVYYRYVALCL